MAEVAPSADNGGGGRKFLLIVGGLAAVLFIGLLALAALFFLPGLLGTNQVAVVSTPTATRIVIPPTSTRTPAVTATRVVSNQPTPVLGAGERQIVVEIGADNEVTMTTYEGGKAPLVQTGTWQADASRQQVTLTFTTLNGKAFKDEIVFQVENGALVPISYNRALHGDINEIPIKRIGESSSFLLPLPGRAAGVSMPAAQATATPNPFSGSYSGTLPPLAPGQHIAVLALNADSGAVLADMEAGKSSVLELGTWTTSGNTVTINFTDKDGTAVQDTLTLELKDDELVGANYVFKRAPDSQVTPGAPAVGTWIADLAAPGTATPIPITATPVPITATPTATQMPDTGAGEDLLLLFGGGLLLLGVIVVVRRLRSA